MKKLTKPFGDYSDLGLYVTLAISEDDKIHMECELRSLYRVELLITLPEKRKQTWRKDVLLALQKAESGMAWSVRFSSTNLLQFLSEEDAQWIEDRLGGATVYLYDVAAKPEYTTEQMLEMQRAHARAAYRRRKQERALAAKLTN